MHAQLSGVLGKHLLFHFDFSLGFWTSLAFWRKICLCIHCCLAFWLKICLLGKFLAF